MQSPAVTGNDWFGQAQPATSTGFPKEPRQGGAVALQEGLGSAMTLTELHYLRRKECAVAIASL